MPNGIRLVPHPLRLMGDEAALVALAARIARRLAPGEGVLLQGELGAGKSVVARAMLRALGVTDPALPSPTFAIVQTYESPKGPVAHMDWYRIADPEELEAIGVREMLAAPWIFLVEWPERAPALIPPRAWRIRLRFVPQHPLARLVEIAPPSDAPLPQSRPRDD